MDFDPLSSKVILADDMNNGSRSAVDIWRPGPAVFPFIKGRVGLYAILRACGIGEGDEVVIPGFTCVVVAAAIQYTGARPVFYDIDPCSYNGDPVLAANAIGNRTRAVVIQHTFGMPMDPGALVDICRERGIVLIEDTAHAMGATIDGRAVGALGDAAFASFQWSKPVTTGLGGLARINTPDLGLRMAELYDSEFQEPAFVKSLYLALLSGAYNRLYRSDHYWRVRESYQKLVSLGVLSGSSSEVELINPEMPPRYCERFGKIRRGQLESALRRLSDVIIHRRRIAGIYSDWFREHGMPVQSGPVGAESVWLRFPLQVGNRPAALREARDRRIELGDWFNAPLHPSIANAEAFGYRAGLCPVADRISARVINLPTHTGVTMAAAEKTLAFVESL